MKLTNEQISDMLKQTNHFLEMDNIKFVAIDVDEYKKGNGFIDFSTFLKYRDSPTSLLINSEGDVIWK